MHISKLVNFRSIAENFADLLCEEIGKDDYRNVVNRNKPSAGFCLSHDYCDANMIMQEAIKQYGILAFNDDEEITELYTHIANKSWDIFVKDGINL